MTDRSNSDSDALSRIYAWFSAIVTEDTELLEDFLAHGVPIDVPHPLRHSTALMEATRLGRIAAVLWLLERGATPAFLSGLPQGTPLHCAIRRGHWAIARLLTDAMETTSLTDAYGRTPLHLMCSDGLEGKSIGDAAALMPLIIAKGCSLDALDQDGATALHHSVMNDLPELAEILLQRGANPNATIPDTGVSPLMLAALEQNLTLSSLLLKYHADPYQTNKEGLSSLAIQPSIIRAAGEMVAEVGRASENTANHSGAVN